MRCRNVKRFLNKALTGPEGPASVKERGQPLKVLVAGTVVTAGTAETTVGLGPGFVDGQLAAAHFLAVQVRNRILRCGLVRHFNETKASGYATELVLDNRHGTDLTMGLKDLAQFLLGSDTREIADVDIHHLLLLCVNSGATVPLMTSDPLFSETGILSPGFRDTYELEMYTARYAHCNISNGGSLAGKPCMSRVASVPAYGATTFRAVRIREGAHLARPPC